MAICPNGHDSASDDFCDICGMRIAGSPSPGSVAGTASPGGAGSGGYGPAGTGGYGPDGNGGYGSAGGGAPSGRPGSAPSPAMGMPGPGPGPGAAGGGDPCPRCGIPRVGQFCEACGYKFGAGQPPWSPAPHAPPPASGLSSSSPPMSAPWPPPSAQPVPSRSSAPSVPSVPSVPTAQPVSPTRPVPPAQYALGDWTAVVSCDRAYFESVQAASGPDAATVPFPGYYAERRFRLTGSQMRIGRRSVSRGIDPEIDLTGPPADPGISRLHAVLIAMPDGSWSVLDPGSANGTLVNGTEVPTGVQVPLRDGDRINLGAWTAIAVHRGQLSRP
jgi:FHA domain